MNIIGIFNKIISTVVIAPLNKFNTHTQHTDAQTTTASARTSQKP